MKTSKKKMSEQTKRRMDAAREASVLVKKLPVWMLSGLQLTSGPPRKLKPMHEYCTCNISPKY